MSNRPSRLSSPRHRPRPRSCMECYRRKLRCDRTQACSNCTVADVECVYTDEPIRRDRKSKHRNEELVDRIAALERLVYQLLAQNSLREYREESQEPPREGESSATQQPPGHLLADNHGKTRLLTDTFWGRPSKELGSLNGSLGGNSVHYLTSPFSGSLSYENFLFPQAAPQIHIAIAKPDLSQIRQLWGIYVQNIDPIIKVLHKPSIDRYLNDISLGRDMFNPETRALMLAICYAAVSSMPSSQARIELGCDCENLTASFRIAVEKALSDAHLLQTHDLRVVQAFSIFLTCLPRKETRSIGILSSIAVRVSRAMGLHRDGSLFKLSPFETEMRRRLWWHLCLLEWRAAEDAGLETTITPSSFDTRFPLNINDNEMDTTSLSLRDRHGHTEMTFSLVRYEAWPLAASWRSRNMLCPCQRPVGSAEKEEALEKLLSRLEDTYLQYCRPISTPITRILLMMVPQMIAKMRLLASYPVYHRDDPQGTTLTPGERDALFRSAIDLIELDQLIEADGELRGWRWFFANTHIPWHAMSFALSELCIRVEGEIENTAWNVIERVFPSVPLGLGRPDDSVWEPLQGLKQKALSARYSITSQLSVLFPNELSNSLFDELSGD
ncbi:fungal-specific transcription factor domain-containing protein [Hypoxylon trugodes]|uniref:fungal-specific transcription factor domain-containing protein n=1 Tax=Hypoxylon trugodes TaxID=326681 RepID=UPI0021950897|nr:fungal-specific transcription factor domain-containing protein [Hypoxylon trugodes]KAI1388758.1 fungal-specific transcription factor domain-containing protein [Hypoxylon trugodes]